MTYDEILIYFQVKRRYQDKAQCKCPAHDDKQASLTVTKGRDSVLIHCHANCSTENVLSAADIVAVVIAELLPVTTMKLTRPC